MKTSIIFIENGAERFVEAEAGEKLSEVLCRNDAQIDMPCGCKGICKKCGVYVNGKKRLACQTAVEAGMRVEFGSSNAVSNSFFFNCADIPPRDPMYFRYGIAVDIGTTTLYAALFGVADTAQAITRKNPQTIFGADVISRIEKALSGSGGGLADCIRGALNEMIVELCKHSYIEPESVDAIVIAGNTAMLYLLTGQNPAELSHAPFQADRLYGEYLDAPKLGLAISPCARIYLPRCASAFVGGDVAAAILASGMCMQEETAMLVDIGTNGEIAIWHKGKLACCSTAAGPAFEGAGILHGVYGVNGAIDRVWHENGQIRCSTIAGAEAVGICGSGIVDALAVMLELGIIDETGAFKDGKTSLALQNDICITASDVRKIQLAKGSVRAGMETLLEASAVSRQEVKTLYIAGGFGSFINLKNAAAIGLIPKEWLLRTKVIGNAAHIGAAMLLQDKSLVQVSEQLAAHAHTVAMDANPVFTDNYMTYMMFE